MSQVTSFIGALALIALGAHFTWTSEPARPGSRLEFAQALAKVKEGMPEREVLELLGKPDDVRTHDDLEGVQINRMEKILCYGTNGHDTFPTLGSVSIDTEGKAQYISGRHGIFSGRSEPSKVLAAFNEDELREVLRLIDTAPELNGSSYNPLHVIRIVNRLQPLGEEKALAAIDEYLRVSEWHRRTREGLFLVLRALYEVPKKPGHMPAMLVGAPSPAEPKNPKLVPRFPILLQDDIPLLLVSGYNLSGFPQQVTDHVEYFRTHGTFRARPLVPPANPLTVLERIPADVRDYLRQENADWSPHHDRMLQDQLFRLIYSVYHKKGLRIQDGRVTRQGYYHKSPPWAETSAAVAKLKFGWDAGRQEYRFTNGSVLPPEPVYPPVVWKPKGFDLNLELIIERQDEERINVDLLERDLAGAATSVPTMSVYAAAKDKERPLAEFKGLGVRNRRSSWEGLKLRQGGSVQARLWSGKEEILSPVWTP